MKIKNNKKYKFNNFSIIFRLAIIIIIIPQISNQLSIPISKDMNCYYIKLFFNKEKTKPESVKINLALDFTFIPLSQNISSQIDNSNSKIYIENEIVEIDNIEYNTKLISTNNFYLEEENNININNFRFYYINKKEMNKYYINKNYNVYNNLFYGQFGLSPLYDDNNLNILYILKEQKIIEQMSFGIYFDKTKNNNYLFLGDINKNKNDFLKDKTFSRTINLDKKLLKKYNKWGTKIDALVVEKTNDLVKHSNHKYFAYFNIIEDRIFVPDKIMEYLITRVFNVYFKNNICFVTEYSDKKFINCKKNKIIEEKDNFPSIIFVIKNLGFKLNFEDLFIDSLKENELIFIIQKNYYDIDTSIILFGSRFIKKYLIEFDLEKYNIIFHSEKVLPLIDLDNIDDDFWRDLVRDYNKETEHYDSNYGDDDKEEDKKDNNNNNNKENTENKNVEEKNINNNDNGNNNKNEKNNNNNSDNDISNDNENKKIKIEFDYDYLNKFIYIFLFIIAIFIGICIFLRFRKKIRIENEKQYFNQPLNKDKNSDE